MTVPLCNKPDREKETDYVLSGQVKSELCRTLPAQRCCALAQCFGILLYCNTFTGDAVRIVTESRELGELLPKLFRKAFGFSFDGPSEALGAKRCFWHLDA